VTTHNLNFTKLAVISALLVAPILGQADGSLGATSTATMELNFTKASSVKISNLTDVNFGSHDFLADDVFLVHSFCVFSSSGRFSLQLNTDNPAGGDFNMRSGSNLLTYSIHAGSSVTDPTVESGPTYSGLYGRQNDPGCSGSNNVEFGLHVTTSDFNLANPGSYSDTLTLTVMPE